MEKIETAGLPGRILLTQQGKEYLWFGGTDYLGMAHHPGFAGLIREGLQRYGAHYGSSRNGPVEPAVYAAAEKQIADFAGAEAALTVSSGMWAGQLLCRVVGEVIRKYYADDRLQVTVRLAPQTHPALWSERPRAGQGSVGDWLEQEIADIAAAPEDRVHLLCFDAVGSPWVSAPDLAPLQRIPPGRKVWVIADDSHGLGVTGAAGAGIYGALRRMEGLKPIVNASLNKAMGVPGGVIFSEERVVALIRATPWFAGSSPVAPAYLYAMEQLLVNGGYRRALERLQDVAERFRSGFPHLGRFSFLPGYPVFCSRIPGLHEHLLQQDIFVPCFPYPDPSDVPVLRLVLNAMHSDEDIDRLISGMSKWDF